MKLFDSVSMRRPKKNKFDLSHERKMSCAMGNLNPIMVQEVVPGDSFRVNSEIFIRLMPMLAPVMHRVNVFTHYFFVPNRLVWDEWEDFITGGREGTSEPVAPHCESSSLTGYTDGDLPDLMGLPDMSGGITDTALISLLPFRAYQLIYDEFYRDQNLSASLDISKASGYVPGGAELTKLMTMRKRAWEKDYFTSALPWAQRGGEVSAPVEGTIGAGTWPTGFQTGSIRKDSDNTLAGTGALSSNVGTENISGTNVHHEIIGEGELTGGGMIINELRRALKLQEWLEKNARGGARYIEQILSHFGVRSSDARLQRPEYLGGGKQPIVISEVVASANSTIDSTEVPQGNMAGHGASFGTSNGFKRSFEEHGYIIGIMSVLPKTAYQQGIPRHFSRLDKLDYYWPEFAHLGEQAVLKKELFFNPVSASGTGAETFGYQSRYAEYKFGNSSVHGNFRDSLSFWHMGRIFSSVPALNASFIESDPTSRIFAVEDDEQPVIAQIFNRVDALRPMPYFGTPTL